MSLFNELYETDSPTHWIGTFKELAFTEHSKIRARLRGEFREAAGEDGASSEIRTDALAEDEVEAFAEFLRENGA